MNMAPNNHCSCGAVKPQSSLSSKNEYDNDKENEDNYMIL